MLNKAQVNVGRLIFWSLMSAGAVALGADFLFASQALGALSIILVMLACSIAVSRTVDSHDVALRQAFEIGREHERLQSVRSI